jgi:hypothetical protein|tara:strand:- start:2183 stop:3073 length:891 start_codon:yes stop_codon:yes gene_type:complete
MVDLVDTFKGFGESIGSGIEAIGKARYKGDVLDKDEYVTTTARIKLDKKIENFKKINDGKEPEPDELQELQLQAMQEAQLGYDDYKKDQLSFFGEITQPKSLAAGAGILASILAARQSQKRYDDYMATRPKYDPGQNPYMAQGGGIQAFAQGTKPIGQKTLSEMMIMNLKEKPMSFLMKSMAAGYAPSDVMDIMSIFGMRDGGGIQSFKFGGTDGSAEQFPYDQAKKFTGTVRGPGDGQSDDIPAFLSNDEHVVTKQEVETIGKMLGGDVDTGHEALYAMRGGIKKLGDKMGVSYT